jgi:hypothetical protein
MAEDDTESECEEHQDGKMRKSMMSDIDVLMDSGIANANTDEFDVEEGSIKW